MSATATVRAGLRPAATRTDNILARARRHLRFAPGWGLGLILPAAIALLWEAGARAGWIPDRLLPPPSTVAATIHDLAASGDLTIHTLATLQRVALGFGLGIAVATALGALTGYSALGRQLLDPIIQGLRNIPSIAWVPLFILWFGIFETSKVTLIAVGAFFPVYLGLSSGIRDVDRKLVEVGRVYNLSGGALIRRILLPAALPAYVVSLRSALGLAWMFVVAAEMMGASEGLGYLLVDGQMTSRPAVIMAAIILFAVIGKLTDALLTRLSRPLLGWQDSFKPQA